MVVGRVEYARLPGGMSTEIIPKRPTGNSPRSRFAQAVWEKLWGAQVRQQDVSGTKVNRTARGVVIVPAGR